MLSKHEVHSKHGINFSKVKYKNHPCPAFVEFKTDKARQRVIIGQ